MDKKKKSRKRVGKINPILYEVAYDVLKLKYKKYNISFDNEVVKSIKGPAIIVATHTCDQDHILSALTLHPVRPTYIVSEHFMRNPQTAKLLKHMHVITKKMFTPDVSTIRNVLRAKGEGSVIVIFPEGRLSCYGKTLPVAEGTAELIKKLGVNLYAWKAEGAYLTFPKWRNKGDSRIGKINASVKLLLSAEQIAEKSIDEIKAVTAYAIYNDDEKAMAGVEYKCENIAAGVDKVLFKCPKCLREGSITSDVNHIRCECGLDAILDNYYKLHDAPFESINEWFDWQQNSIDTERESIFAKARLGTPGEDGFMDPNAGEGEVYIDKNVFRLKGTLHGEEVSYEVAPEKIGAFPISPGDHIDVYVHGKLVYIYPEPDLRSSVKWVCFLDKLTSEKAKVNQ